MIEFNEVTSIYPGGIKCLDKVSFSVEEGAFTALLGPSGAGKSTILWHIIGELAPCKGNIQCMGCDPTKLQRRKKILYRRKIGFVPQELMLLENRTVYENVNIILRGINLSRKEAEVRTHNVLDIVGLRNRLDAKPNQLSGGEQQRLAIARALGVNPQIIMADEPTGNLDPKRAEDIMLLFKQINEMGITVLVATHEWRLMEQLGADIIYVDQGKISTLEEKEAYYFAKY